LIVQLSILAKVVTDFEYMKLQSFWFEIKTLWTKFFLSD